MGSLSTVFSAGVMAILRCTELLLTKNLMRRRIHICSDSGTTESPSVWECMQVLGKRNEHNEVTSVWITGNERADRLATEGPIEVPPTQYTTIPLSAGKKLIKKQLELEHQAK